MTRHGVRLRLEHQPKMVLRLLIEANGDLVTRSQLFAALWQGESEGDFDRRLDKAIAKLRFCLQDNPQKPRYIETLRGLGYRLLVKVSTERNGSGKEDIAAQVEAPLSIKAVPERFGPEMREAPAMPPDPRRGLFHDPFDLQKSAASASLTLAEETYFAAQAAEIRTELLFKAVIIVDGAIEMGSNVHGDRRLAPIVSGWFEGPTMKGAILPGSIDWQQIRSDNVMEIEARYTLKTHDGVPIRVITRAYRHRPAQATKRLAAGEATDPAEYYFRGAPIFDAPSGPYDWLNRSLFICTGKSCPGSVVIHAFEIL